MRAFDPALGAACLAALADGGCSASDVQALTACGSVLHPSAPEGAACQDSADCDLPDSGIDTRLQGTPGCLVDPTSLSCGGVCSRGHAFGQLCSSAPGDGCSDGPCVLLTPTDGGPSADFCGAWAQLGETCSLSSSSCIPDGYCIADGDGGGTCAARTTLGSPCVPADCTSAGRCACPENGSCQLLDDGGGDCVPSPQVGDVCSPRDVPACPSGSSCALMSWEDGGNRFDDGGYLMRCTGVTQALGAPCDPVNGLGCGVGTCTSRHDGTCVLPGAVGDPCMPDNNPACEVYFACEVPVGGLVGSCVTPPAFGEPCTGACALLTSCVQVEDGGSVCLFDAALGQPCNDRGGAFDGQIADPNIGICGEGYCGVAPDSGLVCLPQSPPGTTCDPQQINGNSCLEGACTPDGTGGNACIGSCHFF